MHKIIIYTGRSLWGHFLSNSLNFLLPKAILFDKGGGVQVCNAASTLD